MSPAETFSLRKFAALTLVLCCSACVTNPRLDAPLSLSALPEGFSASTRVHELDRRFYETQEPEFAQNIARAADDGSIDFLALSGGGAGGAYGAGVLVGMTEAHTRPQFEVVTGVSTG